MREIKFASESGSLSQSYSVGIKMSLLNEEFKGIHPPATCKDYFTDVFWSEATGESFNIYGFKWTPKQHECLLKDTINVGLQYNGIGGKKDNLQTFLRDINTLMGFPQATVEASPDNNHLLIISSREWFTKPVYISLYFCLLRVGLSYDGTTPTVNWLKQVAKRTVNLVEPKDAAYLENKNFEAFLEGNWRPTQRFEDYGPTYIHSYSGLITYNIAHLQPSQLAQ